MRIILALVACLALGGCYDGYKFGGCEHEDAHHHTANDFGGIKWCVPNGRTASSGSSLLW